MLLYKNEAIIIQFITSPMLYIYIYIYIYSIITFVDCAFCKKSTVFPIFSIFSKKYTKITFILYRIFNMLYGSQS